LGYRLEWSDDLRLVFYVVEKHEKDIESVFVMALKKMVSLSMNVKTVAMVRRLMNLRREDNEIRLYNLFEGQGE
tara:strand:+ start:11326 stop:11547 length:222 start_codon:yes stop_codon:yes gene_type:complete